MAVFTLNWYLYKTHFKPNCTGSKILKSGATTEVYESKKIAALQILRKIDDEL